MVQALLQDLRFAVRRLAKSPGFTALVILILALGIGANSAIFSVVDAALLRPLPFREPDRLMQLWETESAEGRYPLTGADYLDWQTQNTTFENLAVYSHQRAMNASGAGEPERVMVVETQANFFSTLGVQPMAGRAFLAGEDQAGKNRVVLLSYPFWQAHFGGDRNVVGKQMELNGAAYEIVGVMPAWYRSPGAADLWVPMDMSPKYLGPRGEHHLRALGRLKPGVTVAQADADLKGIAARLEKQFPDSNEKVSGGAAPLRDLLAGQSREPLYILLGAVALVLLIACANVANLLLARAAGRRREVALRAAMGASSARIIRQLLTESVLLSLMGGAAGILVAYGAVQLITGAEALPIPRANPIGVDFRVLLFTLGVSVGVGILFGLAPALQASRVSLNDDLRSSGKSAGAAGSAGGHLLRDVLVGAEIALSLMLLTGAGLLLRTFANLRNAELGVHAESVLAASVMLPPEKYQTIDPLWDFYRRLVESLEKAPGVRAAVISTELPLEGGNNGYITVDGQNADTKSTLVEWNYVTPNYFRALGIPVHEGRDFNAADLSAAAEVARKAYAEGRDDNRPAAERPQYETLAIINQAMARRFWPNQPVTGRVFRQQNVAFRVIGVVGDVKVWGLRNNVIPQAYFPFTLALGFPGGWPANVVVQAEGRPSDVAGIIRSHVRALDSGLAVANMRTIGQIVSDSMTDTSYQTLLLGVFAALALVLAMLGIYGVMSYTVSQRTNEFGIRMALGAGPSSILRMVAGQGARLALAGAAAGVAASLAVAGVLRKMLFGVDPTDPATLAMVTLVTVAVCMAACAIPAWRASRVDPMVALRYE